MFYVTSNRLFEPVGEAPNEKNGNAQVLGGDHISSGTQVLFRINLDKNVESGGLEGGGAGRGASRK